MRPVIVIIGFVVVFAVVFFAVIRRWVSIAAALASGEWLLALRLLLLKLWHALCVVIDSKHCQTSSLKHISCRQIATHTLMNLPWLSSLLAVHLIAATSTAVIAIGLLLDLSRFKVLDRVVQFIQHLHKRTLIMSLFATRLKRHTYHLLAVNYRSQVQDFIARVVQL